MFSPGKINIVFCCDREGYIIIKLFMHIFMESLNAQKSTRM